MNRVDRLKRLFEYDDWANRETLASLPDRTPALPVLAHVLGAERLWLARLRGAKPATVVWPDLNPERCREEIAELESEWTDWFEDLDPDGLEASIEYVNSKGERWKNSVGDVLSHVLLHSAYHRGQVATLLRQAGRAPAYTDFVHCVRQGFVE